MNFIQAKSSDQKEVIHHYLKVIEETNDNELYSRWKVHLYPKVSDIEQYLYNDQMYLLKDEDQIVGSVALTIQNNEDYHKIDWGKELNDNEVMVVHLFSINPDYQRQGYGKALFNHIFNLARNKEIKAVRLDALDSNLPDKELYLKQGFKYCGKLCMYADNTGLTDFCFYEYIL